MTVVCYAVVYLDNTGMKYKVRLIGLQKRILQDEAVSIVSSHSPLINDRVDGDATVSYV